MESISIMCMCVCARVCVYVCPCPAFPPRPFNICIWTYCSVGMVCQSISIFHWFGRMDGAQIAIKFHYWMFSLARTKKDRRTQIIIDIQCAPIIYTLPNTMCQWGNNWFLKMGLFSGALKSRWIYPTQTLSAVGWPSAVVCYAIYVWIKVVFIPCVLWLLAWA